jgi:hypothetical protein
VSAAVEHGTVNGYIRGACRCDACSGAHREYLRAYRTPTRNSHRNMLQRTAGTPRSDPGNPNWRYYGGASPPVRVDERWHQFENFLADMGERPDGTQLGRFLDRGDYGPGNCAWMTRADQAAEQAKKRALARGDVLVTRADGTTEVVPQDAWPEPAPRTAKFVKFADREEAA